MKKALMWVIAVIVAVGVVCGCVYWYKSATEDSNLPSVSGDNISGDNISGENTSGENTSGENTSGENLNENTPLFTLETYPRVDASLAIHPLVDSIASDFLGIPVDELNYEYTKTRTSEVYRNLIDGKVDIVFAAEPSSGDLEYAKSKGVELDIIPATSSAFVFIVNSKNPVENLTLDEIVKIYKGDITNWKEVGGDDEEIIPYQRPIGSGSQTAMISLVMKDEELMYAPQRKVVGQMDELVNAIAEYDNSKQSLGYSYFYYVNTMYQKDTIKMIGVNGVKPTIETIKDGTYPIYTNGYIAVRKDAAEDSSARKWVNAVLSERGSKIITNKGYVPVN